MIGYSAYQLTCFVLADGMSYLHEMAARGVLIDSSEKALFGIAMLIFSAPLARFITAGCRTDSEV